jgi:hypothetical protein
MMKTDVARVVAAGEDPADSHELLYACALDDARRAADIVRATSVRLYGI